MAWGCSTVLVCFLFDERSCALVGCLGRALRWVVKNFRCLGQIGCELIDQTATSVVGQGDGGSGIHRKGAVKVRLHQVVSVTTKVAISARQPVIPPHRIVRQRINDERNSPAFPNRNFVPPFRCCICHILTTCKRLY